MPGRNPGHAQRTEHSTMNTDRIRCSEVRERLPLYMGGDLDPDVLEGVAAHLAGCGECSKMADDALHDCAYPEIKGGVRAFIARYLAAPETVLVLQGPPGTGKTRLIRAILGEISRRKGEEAECLYTGDMKALEGDALFVKFITGTHDAFVVEDADHLLKPRSDGNEHLHRFLTIADGVVRSQGRKIIFSTNLPNVGDLDEALIRPGRCFARIHVRALTSAEAQVLAAEIAAGDAEKLARASLTLAAGQGARRSLAEVYSALR